MKPYKKTIQVPEFPVGTRVKINPLVIEEAMKAPNRAGIPIGLPMLDARGGTVSGLFHKMIEVRWDGVDRTQHVLAKLLIEA